MCMAGDMDGPEFYSESWQKTKKVRKCGECNREIEIGERYFKAIGKWDGDFRTKIQCAHCNLIAGEWLMEHCHGFLFGQIQEDIAEHEHEGAYTSVAEKMEIVHIVTSMDRQWRTPTGRLMRLPKKAAV